MRIQTALVTQPCGFLPALQVAYHDECGELVVSRRSIALHYARQRLWLDLLTTLPFDWIVLGALGLQDSNSELAWCVRLLLRAAWMVG